MYISCTSHVHPRVFHAHLICSSCTAHAQHMCISCTSHVHLMCVSCTTHVQLISISCTVHVHHTCSTVLVHSSNTQARMKPLHSVHTHLSLLRVSMSTVTPLHSFWVHVPSHVVVSHTPWWHNLLHICISPMSTSRAGVCFGQRSVRGGFKFFKIDC